MVENLNFIITYERRAVFVKGAIQARRRQSELVRQNETQNLTWDIIFHVAEGLFKDKQIFVTDVCHAVMASKSSTIKALDRLVREGVLVRAKDKSDRRRKILSLSKAFEPKFLAYLDEFIFSIVIEELVEQAEVSTIWSAQTTNHLLSSLKDAPIPIMIHAEDGEILMISKEWERLTGYDHSEIPTIEKWTEKAYAKNNTVSEVRELISELYKIDDEHFDGVAVIFTKSGEQRKWNFRSSPLGKLSDGRANIISIATDIS